MKSLRWKGWRDADGIDHFCRVWHTWGLIGMVGFVLFMLFGLSVMVWFFSTNRGQGEMLFIFLGSVAIGMASLFYGGFAVSLLANSVRRRLDDLEARLVAAVESRPPDSESNALRGYSK